MLEELRLNPRAHAARSGDGCTGDGADTDVGTVDPNLSTGFANQGRLRSTGVPSAIHRVVWCRIDKEGVG